MKPILRCDLFLLQKMFKKYRSRKLKHPIHNDDKGDQALISHIDSILAKIDREQEAGLRIYTETKNKVTG